MTALNIPSGSDIERLERRLRSSRTASRTLEDHLDEVGDDLVELRRRLAASERAASDQARVSAPDAGERVLSSTGERAPRTRSRRPLITRSSDGDAGHEDHGHGDPELSAEREQRRRLEIPARPRRANALPS